MGFMVRYLDVVTGEMRRMRVARESRGFEARGPAALAGAGALAGALFIRSYERGERVHLAMLVAGLRPARCRPDADRAPGDAHLMSAPPSSTSAGLAYAYPDGHQALFGVDLHVHQGERVALLGPNGAGKTTLVLHLNGILTAGAGTVAVSGMPVDQGQPAEIRRRVGVVFQDPDDQLFMPRCATTSRSGRPTSGCAGAELERAGRRRARPGRAWSTSSTVRRTTSPSGSGVGSRSRPCSRWSPRSSCSTSRRPTSTPPRAASSPTSSARST